jgi:hypothetical protein
MTRQAIHLGRLAVLSGALFIAIGCPSEPESLALDTTLLVTAHVKPVPEKGDEHPNHAPPADSLGGPYKKYRPGSLTNLPTAEAPVPLTTTVNDSVLAEYLDGLNFDNARANGELALIRCPAGSPPGCAALLYIEPEIGMKKRRYIDVPTNGMVVARIVNYSSTEVDSTYHVPPLRRAYWYIDHDGSTLRSRVFIRTPGGANTLQFIGPVKEWTDCGHPPSGGPAIAKFQNCVTFETAMRRGDPVIERERNPFIRPVSFGPSSPPLPIIPTVDALRESDLWVKCAQGCCIAG